MYGLESPAGYKLATIEERAQLSNGCGPAGGGRLVPDTLLGLDISAACNIHDWEYGTSDEPRSVVDARFHRNMLAMVDRTGGPLKWFRRVIVWWYYRAVQKSGAAYFGQIQ